MTNMETLFNKTNEELREWFRNEVNKVTTDAHYAEYNRRCEERRQNIERDFQDEWSNKHFKWFFKKRRQQKLHREIELRYPGPMFWILEDIIDETLPKTTNAWFGQIVEIKEN